MFLTKLKQITEDWCSAKVADAVIAVPSSFSDFQRIPLSSLGSIHVTLQRCRLARMKLIVDP
ncbi:Chaperone protein DnaK (HSP70) (Heat shock 70 kDa protein) (Heat shock protein 70) [Durusdinium trenchii]|uniref:Chaperone protein DnaK (HSP70) (Heat shock 70 kDa protein) (Heat shock protein 70) n=1 Tax=Durusdinium trenchii TaxID=1381693 RepID=A0ABP0L184_9DINO